jgi:hypothetical protein
VKFASRETYLKAKAAKLKYLLIPPSGKKIGKMANNLALDIVIKATK